MIKTQYLSPDGLSRNPAFSQLVVTHGPGKTIYIGGQNAVDENSQIAGKGDLAVQTDKVLQNIEIALNAAGATFENLVKITIFILKGQDIRVGFEASQKYFSHLKNKPAITGIFVSALAHPDYLVEIEGVAFVEE